MIYRIFPSSTTHQGAPKTRILIQVTSLVHFVRRPLVPPGDCRGSSLYSEASSPEYQFLVCLFDPNDDGMSPTFTHQDMGSTDNLLGSMFFI